MVSPEGIRGRLTEDQIIAVGSKMNIEKGMLALAEGALRESGHANQVGGGVELEIIERRLTPLVQKALEEVKRHLTPDATPDQLKKIANYIVSTMISEE